MKKLFLILALFIGVLSFLLLIIFVFFGYQKYSRNIDLNNKRMCGEQKQKLENQLNEQNKESGIQIRLIEMFYSNKKNTCISVEILRSRGSISAEYFIEDHFTGETLDKAEYNGEPNQLLEILKKYKD